MSIKEGSFVSRPPLLERTNYAYWKVRTRIFIQSIDDSAWNVVEYEWIPLTKKVENEATKRN